MNTIKTEIPVRPATIEEVEAFCKQRIDLFKKGLEAKRFEDRLLPVVEGALGALNDVLNRIRPKVILQVVWNREASEPIAFDGADPEDWADLARLFDPIVKQVPGRPVLAVGPFPCREGQWGVVRFPDGTRKVVTKLQGRVLVEGESRWACSITDESGKVRYEVGGL